VNGLGMLLHQGAVAFELWTGVSPPLEVMRRALRSAASPARASATSAARPDRARPASARRR